MRPVIYRLFPANMRQKVKHRLRKCKCKFQFWVKPMTLEDMRHILTVELCIKKCDRIFVTSAFGSLHATFSPQELVQLLMDIVTPEGMILMPYYPPGSSTDWAKSGSVFNMQTTKASTGIVTNVFSTFPDVVKSLHPTKSVCAWGKGAANLIAGHIGSTTPFSGGSPYDKFLALGGSKSVGLGSLKYPMGHCIEDIVSGTLSQYKAGKATLKIMDGETEYICDTYVHDESRHQIPPHVFVTGAPTYKRVKMGYSEGFVVENSEAFGYYKSEFAKGRKSTW